jgi:hypothetical protein
LARVLTWFGALSLELVLLDRMEDRTFKAYFWSFLTVLTGNIHDATYRKRSRTRPPFAKSTLPCAQKEWSKNIRFSLEIDGSDLHADGRGAHPHSSPVRKREPAVSEETGVQLLNGARRYAFTTKESPSQVRGERGGPKDVVCPDSSSRRLQFANPSRICVRLPGSR